MMAERSRIAWTRSTFNPWIGCTKVSPGCDHCYASVSTPARTMGIQWGAGQARRRTSPANWKLPMRWNEAAPHTTFAGRKGFWPVFCSSLADVFDNEVPAEWRRDLFDLIAETPNLTWLLLTKRIGNAEDMINAALLDDGPLWPWPNVWLGATIVNQEEADRDVPKLLEVPAAKRFVSYEPALGPVDFTRVCDRSTRKALWINSIEARDANPAHEFLVKTLGPDYPYTRLDWIIVGGDSDQRGMRARPFDLEWARSTVRQCKVAGVPVFIKQAGSFVTDRNDADFDGSHASAWPEHIEREGRIDWAPFGYEERYQGAAVRIKLRDRAGADPAEWPEDLRVQDFPA